MKQKLTEWKGVTDKSTDTAGDFNIPLQHLIEQLERKSARI